MVFAGGLNDHNDIQSLDWLSSVTLTFAALEVEGRHAFALQHVRHNAAAAAAAASRTNTQPTQPKQGRAKVFSLSSSSSSSGDENSDGASAKQAGRKIGRKKGRAAPKAGSKAASAGAAGKKSGSKKRSSSTSSEKSAAAAAAAATTSQWDVMGAAEAGALDGDGWGLDDTSPELDPWVALSSDGPEELFYNSAAAATTPTPAHLHIQQLHGAHAMMRGGGAGARADAWGSDLLEFNSGHYDGFDADYLAGAGAASDNAGWLPTTYLPGMQHSASPLPGMTGGSRCPTQMLMLG
jgi:hypothetical protein